VLTPFGNLRKNIDRRPKFEEPEPTETCVYMNTPLGIAGYSGTESNKWGWLLGDPNERYYESLYETCFRYDFGRVISGYWASQKQILGTPYNAAVSFGTLVIVFGLIWLALLWSASCVAYTRRFMKFTTGLLTVLGVFMLFTLLFFASEVCSNGCQAGKGELARKLKSVVNCSKWSCCPHALSSLCTCSFPILFLLS
jgi:hypothetical protein